MQLVVGRLQGAAAQSAGQDERACSARAANEANTGQQLRAAYTRRDSSLVDLIRKLDDAILVVMRMETDVAEVLADGHQGCSAHRVEVAAEDMG
jgi:hypothetical protein